MLQNFNFSIYFIISVPPAKDWVQPSKKAIKTSVNSPSANFITSFMNDSDFLHVPKPSSKPSSMLGLAKLPNSLVKPPNSVTSQPIKQPNTIRLITKDSGKRAASPINPDGEPPDPLFVIGGNVRKPVNSGTPMNVTTVATEKMWVLYCYF